MAQELLSLRAAHGPLTGGTVSPKPWPPKAPFRALVLCLLHICTAAVWQGGTLPAHKHRASIPRPPLPAHSLGAYSWGPLAQLPTLPGGLRSHVRPMQVAKRGSPRSLLPSQHEGCSHGGGNVWFC